MKNKKKVNWKRVKEDLKIKIENVGIWFLALLVTSIIIIVLGSPFVIASVLIVIFDAWSVGFCIGIGIFGLIVLITLSYFLIIPAIRGTNRWFRRMKKRYLIDVSEVEKE